MVDGGMFPDEQRCRHEYQKLVPTRHTFKLANRDSCGRTENAAYMPPAQENKSTYEHYFESAGLKARAGNTNYQK